MLSSKVPVIEWIGPRILNLTTLLNEQIDLFSHHVLRSLGQPAADRMRFHMPPRWHGRVFQRWTKPILRGLLVRSVGPRCLVIRHGAVSGETAEQMAIGLLNNTGVEIGVAVTGIAGPSGGSNEKPVGLVWFGFGISGQRTYSTSMLFSGDRCAVRLQAVDYALLEMIRLLT